VSSFSRFSLTIARWLTNVYDVDTTAGNPTTTRDVTPQPNRNQQKRAPTQLIEIN
jgi:hypothetical protein